MNGQERVGEDCSGNSRRTRRAVLRGALYGGGGLAAATVLACGGGGGSTSGNAGSGGSGAGGSGGATAGGQTDQPKMGGTLRLSLGGAYNDILDPHTSLNQAATVFSFLGNTALRLNREATNIVPELVEKWEIPGDGMELLLKVRQDVKWHDKAPISGRAFDAQDMAYNLMRIAAKLNPPGEAARFQRRSTLEGMNKAEAIDASTVKVTFDRPTSTFLNGLTDFRNQIIPRDFLDKGGKFEDMNTLIGSGPFVIESFRRNERAMLKRNPNYWKSGMPYLEAIEWVTIPDRLSAASSFTKGDIDAFIAPTKVERETLKKTVSNVQDETWLFSNWMHFRFNVTKKPFDDPRVRRALQLTLNYKAMNDTVYGDGNWAYTGPVPAGFPDAIPPDQVAKLPGWNPSTRDADLQTARQLMTAAGYANGDVGFKVMIYPPQGSVYYEFAIRAIDQWKQAFSAIKPEADLVPDAAVFSQRQVQNDFDVLSFILFPQPDAVLEMSANYHAKGSRNYGKINDPKIDALLEKAAGQLDTNARKGTMKELQDYLINEQMPIITSSMPKSSVFFAPKIRGMKDFGGQVDGGTFDIYRHTERLWLA